MTPQTVFGSSSPESHPPQASTTQSPAPTADMEFSQPTPGALQGAQHAPLGPKSRCYDQPGKKPAADPEPNQVKLHDRVCKARRGSNFATDWVLTAFKYGVSKDALRRFLKPQEIAAMRFTGGFAPRQVYDGFITKVGDWYECGLCKEDKKTHWKTKKDAPRHLCKFHFGLADVCKIWYVPPMPATDLYWTHDRIWTILIAERMCTAKAK